MISSCTTVDANCVLLVVIANREATDAARMVLQAIILVGLRSVLFLVGKIASVRFSHQMEYRRVRSQQGKGNGKRFVGVVMLRIDTGQDVRPQPCDRVGNVQGSWVPPNQSGNQRKWFLRIDGKMQGKAFVVAGLY